MKKDIKLIFILLITFFIAFLTTLLFELEVFSNWLRQLLVVLLVFVELYVGFLVFKWQISQ